jgi:hypothetical protein
MDGSGARMSLRTDRHRSWLGHPMSDRLVDTRPFEQETPSTSSQPSQARPSRWIRRHNKQYTLKGDILIILKLVTLTASASTHSSPIRIATTVLKHSLEHQRLQKTQNNPCAHSLAPVLASGRSRPPPTKPTSTKKINNGMPAGCQLTFYTTNHNTSPLPITHYVHQTVHYSGLAYRRRVATMHVGHMHI